MCFFEKFFFCKVLYFFFLTYLKLVKHHCLSRRWLASDWDWAEAAPRMVQISVPKCQAVSHSVGDARGSLSRAWWFYSLIVWELFPKLLFSTRDFLIWDTFRWGCLWCTWPGQSKGERALPQLSQQSCLLATCYPSQVCFTLFSDEPSGSPCSDHLHVRMKIVGFVQSASHLVCFPQMWRESLCTRRCHLMIPLRTETLRSKSDMEAPQTGCM